jgi:hypothetical protein
MRLNIMTKRAGAFDIALAGFAGAAFAFAAFAMPEWRLTQIVLGSGLPSILPAAQPPLGFTARAGFAALIGLAAFAGSYLLLRLAERAPVRRRPFTEADAPPAPIKLRRADAHPDAPPRRPLAARDLGEPEADTLAAPTPEELLLTPESGESDTLLLSTDGPEPLPYFLVPQAQDAQDAEFEALGAEDNTVLVWPGADSEPEQQSEPEREPEPEPVTIAPVAPAAFEAEPEPEAEPAPEPALQAVAEPAPRPHVAAVPEARAEPADAADEDADSEASLGGLMKRLEFGLARRERSPALDPAAVAPPADAAVGHRLRSAINDLQKLAARG